MTIDLILSRDVSQPIETGILPAGMAIHRVNSTGDEGFPLLESLYSSDGFPPDWARQMLDRGSQAVVVVNEDMPVASALLIRKPYYVQEVRRTFDAGPDADYYFGDFVLPAFRGRGLQRLLIRARLELTHRAARRWAMAMTRSGIPASRENYFAEGFGVASEVRTCKLARLQLEHHRRINPNLACGTLSGEGLGLRTSYILRRAQ